MFVEVKNTLNVVVNMFKDIIHFRKQNVIEASLTINYDCYVTSTSGFWFPQDDARLHTAIPRKDLLKDKFGNKIILRNAVWEDHMSLLIKFISFGYMCLWFMLVTKQQNIYYQPNTLQLLQSSITKQNI